MAGRGQLHPVTEATITPAIKIRFPTRLTGLRNVPTSGPAMIAPNHISFVDVPEVPLERAGDLLQRAVEVPGDPVERPAELGCALSGGVIDPRLAAAVPAGVVVALDLGLRGGTIRNDQSTMSYAIESPTFGRSFSRQASYHTFGHRCSGGPIWAR